MTFKIKTRWKWYTVLPFHLWGPTLLCTQYIYLNDHMRRAYKPCFVSSLILQQWYGVHLNPPVHPRKLYPQDCPPGSRFLWSLNSRTRLNLSYTQKKAEFETDETSTLTESWKESSLWAYAKKWWNTQSTKKDYQCEEVAEALTRAHPCLGQLESRTEFWGWKQSLEYKMQNYRTKLGRLGHPEIRVHSLKHKREGQGKTAANVKKPRQAEVNCIPLHPKGETTESSKEKRIALLSE